MKNKTLFILILFFLFGENYGQDTTYYFGANHKPLESIENAQFYKWVNKKNKSTTKVETYTFVDEEWVLTITEKIKTSKNSQYITIKTKDGIPKSVNRRFYELGDNKYAFYDYIDEKLMRSGTTSRIIPLCLEDTVKTYFKDGQIKSIAFYQNNQLVSNKNWLENGERYYDNLFYSVNSLPEYRLGQNNFNRYILANLFNENIDFSNYQEEILIGWVVTKKGEIEGVHPINNYYPILSNLLVEIIESSPGDWIPAKLNGEDVDYFIQFPVNFRNTKDDGFESLELIGNHLYWD